MLAIKTGGCFKQCSGKDKMAYLHFVVVTSCNVTYSKRPSANLLQSDADSTDILVNFHDTCNNTWIA